MASNLTNQVRSIASVTKAVADGDLSRTVDVDVQGEMLDLKDTVNSMVHQVDLLVWQYQKKLKYWQLQIFAREVTRVALEVGSLGVLGSQAQVEGVQGTWMDLTDSVNVCLILFQNSHIMLNTLANGIQHHHPS